MQHNLQDWLSHRWIAPTLVFY